MYTVVQFKRSEDNQPVYVGDWQEQSVKDAVEAINTLKISGNNCVFVIENENGQTVEVIKR
jgi:hypothetical protein